MNALNIILFSPKHKGENHMSQTTKKAFAASLKKLLSRKTLDNITVKDIAEDCEVQRQTFYYHFQDIYALIEWIYLNEVTKAINDKKTYDTWNQGFNQLFQYILENKSFVINTYRSIKHEDLERYIHEGSYALLWGVVEEQSLGLHVNECDKKFITHFYKYSFAGILLEWIRNGMKEDPQKIIKNIDIMICGNIKNALIKFSE